MLSLRAGIPGPKNVEIGRVLALVVLWWMLLRHLVSSKLMVMLSSAMRLRCKDRGRDARARRSFAPET